MSEFNLFIEKAEFIDVLRDASRVGCKVQMVKKFAAPASQYCSSEAELEAAVNKGQYAFFLERSDFTRYPSRLLNLERDGIKYWYPSSVEGGPVIEVYFSAPFEKDAQKIVPCTLFAHQSKIISRPCKTPGTRMDARFRG